MDRAARLESTFEIIYVVCRRYNNNWRILQCTDCIYKELCEMNLEKAKPVNEEVAELKELIKELHGSVHQLQSEVQQLRHERPVVEVRKGVQLSPAIVGQIGGMILGGLAIIGIFW